MEFKNLYKNIKYNFLFTVIIGFLNLYLNRIFIENLGSEFNGLIRLFTQLLSYLNLAELGIGTASAYALYKPLEENNYEKISIVMTTMRKIYNKIAIVIFLLGLIASLSLKMLVKDFEFYNIYYIYWIVYVLNASLSYMGARYLIFLNAENKLYLTKGIQGTIQILTYIMKILIIIYFKNFMIFLFLNTIEILFNYIIIMKIIKRKYKKINEHTKEIDKSIGKNLFNIFWHKLAGLIVFNTDYILISKYLNLSIVTLYSNYLIIINMIQMIINIIVTPLTQNIGRINANQTKEKTYKLFEVCFSLNMYFAIIITMITYKMINTFIGLWIGNSFILNKTTVILICINLYIVIIRKPVDIFSSTSGFFSDIHIPILESLINFIISLYLIRKIGLNGVILGTVISNILIIYLLKPLLFYKKVFNLNSLIYLKKIIFYLILTVMIIIIGEYFNKYIKSDIKNIFNWIKLMVIQGILYLGLTTLSFKMFDKNFKLIE